MVTVPQFLCCAAVRAGSAHPRAPPGLPKRVRASAYGDRSGGPSTLPAPPEAPRPAVPDLTAQRDDHAARADLHRYRRPAIRRDDTRLRHRRHVGRRADRVAAAVPGAELRHSLALVRSTATAALECGDFRDRRLCAVRVVVLRRAAHLPHAAVRRPARVVCLLGLAADHPRGGDHLAARDHERPPGAGAAARPRAGCADRRGAGAGGTRPTAADRTRRPRCRAAGTGVLGTPAACVRARRPVAGKAAADGARTAVGFHATWLRLLGAARGGGQCRRRHRRRHHAGLRRPASRRTAGGLVLLAAVWTLAGELLHPPGTAHEHAHPVAFAVAAATRGLIASSNPNP
jgi:hypothetical protein